MIANGKRFKFDVLRIKFKMKSLVDIKKLLNDIGLPKISDELKTLSSPILIDYRYYDDESLLIYGENKYEYINLNNENDINELIKNTLFDNITNNYINSNSEFNMYFDFNACYLDLINTPEIYITNGYGDIEIIELNLIIQ